MGEMLEIAKTLIEPGIKLIDAVQSAIGKAYEPTHVRNMADAKAYEISKVASAMREASDVPIIYNKGDLSLDTTDFDAFVKRTQSRMAYQELQKQSNIEAVISKAYKMLDGGERVTNDPLDSDWINRLFGFVGDISSEKMQELWAKTLAGEVKKPSSFSMRTLDVLHNLSMEEALLFEKICSYTVSRTGEVFLPRYGELLEKTGISYNEILQLDDCGLLNSGGQWQLNKKIEKGENLLDRNNAYAIVAVSEYDDLLVTVPAHPLTATGKELYGIVKKEENCDFFFDYGREIKKNNKRCEVHAYRMIEDWGHEVLVDRSRDFIAD